MHSVTHVASYSAVCRRGVDIVCACVRVCICVALASRVVCRAAGDSFAHAVATVTAVDRAHRDHCRLTRVESRARTPTHCTGNARPRMRDVTSPRRRNMADVVGKSPLSCSAKYTWAEVTSHSLWSPHDRHFVGITRYNSLS